MIAFIDDHRGAHGVEPICKVLPIAPSHAHVARAWHADDRRAVERCKAEDAIDTRLASRLAGRWGGYDGAKQLLHAVHARGSEPPKSDRGSNIWYRKGSPFHPYFHSAPK